MVLQVVFGDKKLSLSVVIVNWNTGLLLQRCVSSLLEHGRGCEIIVVDNASEDASLEFLAARETPIVVLRNGENMGFAAACNQGWRSSQGSLVLFLNPDTEAFGDSVPPLVYALDQHKEAWAASGQLISDSRQPQRQYAPLGFPTLASVRAEAYLLDEIWPANPWTCRRPRLKLGNNAVYEVDQPAAACLLVKRCALESLGGFDEDFRPAWFEDVDFCRRIQARGGKILFVPKARFLHRGGVSLQHLGKESFLKHFHSNQIRYFKKHHGNDIAERVRGILIAGLYLRAGISLLVPLMPGASRIECAKAFCRIARHVAAFRGGSQ